eukprot:jgi/Botrbrau1/19930/Bobra.0059s0047.1
MSELNRIWGSKSAELAFLEDFFMSSTNREWLATAFSQGGQDTPVVRVSGPGASPSVSHLTELPSCGTRYIGSWGPTGDPPAHLPGLQDEGRGRPPGSGSAGPSAPAAAAEEHGVGAVPQGFRVQHQMTHLDIREAAIAWGAPPEQVDEYMRQYSKDSTRTALNKALLIAGPKGLTILEMIDHVNKFGADRKRFAVVVRPRQAGPSQPVHHARERLQMDRGDPNKGIHLRACCVSQHAGHWNSATGPC